MAAPGSRRTAEKQRRHAFLLATTGLVRTVAWVVFIVMVLAGVPWAHGLAGKVVFVTLVSLYANAATDFGQFVSAVAALISADARSDVESAQADINNRILRTVEAIEDEIGLNNRE